MGAIQHPLNLSKTFELYDIRNVIETGTGMGVSVQYLCDNFSSLNLSIYSIELVNELYQYNVEKFKNFNNISILLGLSDKVLGNILPNISVDPTLFWLDAHYPGADFGINGASLTSESNLDIRLPLQKELEAIKFNRNTSRDVFILDDLRIYKDGPFENGNCDRTLIGAENNQFVYDLFYSSHYIYETYRHEGYVVLLPKNTRKVEESKIFDDILQK